MTDTKNIDKLLEALGELPYTRLSDKYGSTQVFSITPHPTALIAKEVIEVLVERISKLAKTYEMTENITGEVLKTFLFEASAIAAKLEEKRG